MNETSTGTATADAGQPAQAGTASAGGQPDTSSQQATGQPASGAEPSGEKQPDFQKQYKDLQSDYSRKTEELSRMKRDMDLYNAQFSAYGGVAPALQTMNQLIADPSFRQWAESRKQQQMGGVDKEKLDPESRAALELVEKTAEAKARAYYDKAAQELGAIRNELAQKKVMGLVDQMNQKYPGWNSLQAEMLELSRGLPQSVQNNPSMQDFESLYFQAMARTGKLEEYGEAMYRKKLESMKQKTTEVPKSSSVAERQTFSNALEALQAAKKKHGVTELRF